MKLIYTLSLTLVLLTVLSAPSSAYQSYADEVPGDLNGNCLICHADANGGGDLNSYGIDYSAYQSFEDIASLDSDKDGYTNQEELDEMTLPGDDTSFPEPDEPEGSPGFGFIGMSIGILGALLLINGRERR
ncbi:MAG: hypothetical protein K0A89_05575 [ANME-2 cluster archaeon]|nr:hypothetical protein [ANME-2 cluster archaeon]